MLTVPYTSLKICPDQTFVTFNIVSYHQSVPWGRPGSVCFVGTTEKLENEKHFEYWIMEEDNR